MDVQGTLRYAGCFEGRARLVPNKPANNHFVLEPHEILIRDVRPTRDAYDLDEHGFAFVKHTSAAAADPELFHVSSLRHQTLPVGPQVCYSQELIELLRQYTGASVVLPQMRSFIARSSKRAKTRTWAGPADLVHLDYSSNSVSQSVKWTVEALGLPVPPHRHFAFIQTWRALSPGPQDNGFCLCDGRSVSSEEAVPIDAILGPPEKPGNHFEFRLCKFDARHSWFYLSNMEPDDLVLFKGYDSRYPQAMNAMHSAFDNPLAGPAAVPRHSIEARFLAFYD